METQCEDGLSKVLTGATTDVELKKAITGLGFLRGSSFRIKKVVHTVTLGTDFKVECGGIGEVVGTA